MSLLGVIVVIVIAGVLLGLAETYLPMSAPVKVILRVVVVLVLLLWLLQVFGIGLGTVPRVR